MPSTKARVRTGLLAAAVAATLTATVTATGTATAASGRLPEVRFMAHLNVAEGQRPENITLEPCGGADVTFAYSRQVARVTPDGRARVLATLPEPPAGAVTPALTSPFIGGREPTASRYAGPVETRATIDDIDFTGAGDTLLAAINKNNEVALVRPDGSHSIVLTGADGLENPASLAVRGGTAYIASGAYFTGDDPNVLTAHVKRDK
ncbi:hypothetical protein [Streptomyces sp. AGS-58]|uniref:hypothetical protein n=1 Tax=unclassified Streptomyces TaxID=2593676 RepID=UPI0035A2BA6C